MDRRAITELARTLDDQIRDLTTGEARAALRKTFDQLVAAMEPGGPPLRRGNELSVWDL